MEARGVALGSFDVFHVGHLRALRRAAQLCDHLVVAVASDELHERRCGTPPVVGAEHRVEIVSAFAIAADVVATDVDDATALARDHGADQFFVTGEAELGVPAELEGQVRITPIVVTSTACEALERLTEHALLWPPTGVDDGSTR